MASTPNFSWPTPDDGDLVSEGAQAIRVLGDAVDGVVFANGTAIAGLQSDVAPLAVGFLYAGQVRFESNGSFVKADPLGTGDIGLRAIRVRLVGGGGGGGGAATTGGSQASQGSGGGGGAYVEKFITDVAGLSSSESINRGSGGPGGSAGANAGTAGGSSTAFSLTAAGGGGGAGGPAQGIGFIDAGGAGGTASGGDLNINGGPGEPQIVYILTNAQSREGGASHLSPKTRPTVAANGLTGIAGVLHGGGGGGGANGQNQATARAGGSGANGIVIVDCYV
jgi:hypothetical protein